MSTSTKKRPAKTKVAKDLRQVRNHQKTLRVILKFLDGSTITKRVTMLPNEGYNMRGLATSIKQGSPHLKGLLKLLSGEAAGELYWRHRGKKEIVGTFTTIKGKAPVQYANDRSFVDSAGRELTV